MPKSYEEYLLTFDQLYEIPFSLKEKEYKKYRRYLKNVVAYLKDYFKRVYPLEDFKIID